MQLESGRSLIEVIGVLAVSAIMTAGAIGMYNSVRTRQQRILAMDTIKQIAMDVKTLMGMRENYEGLSIAYLIKAGALQNNKAPIGGDNWSVSASIDKKSFSINLVDLTNGECAYFVQSVPSWTTDLIVNGYNTEQSSHCFSSKTNQISFVSE